MKVPATFRVILAALAGSLAAAAQTHSAVPLAAAESALPAGVVLPKNGMVLGVDSRHAAPELVQFHASEVVSNAHAASNLVRGQVFLAPHATLELDGLNAAVHLEDTQPMFYVRIGFDEPELLRKRVHLIRMEQTANRRVVLKFTQTSSADNGQRSTTTLR